MNGEGFTLKTEKTNLPLYACTVHILVPYILLPQISFPFDLKSLLLLLEVSSSSVADVYFSKIFSW